MNLRSLAQIVPDPEKFLSSPAEHPVVWHMPAEPLTALLTLRDLDRLLSDGLPVDDRVGLARDDELLAPKRFSSADRHAELGTRRFIRAASICKELGEGATIIVNLLDRIWRPVGDFCRRLSFEVGVPINATAFLTPPGSNGLGYHVDHDCAFLVQLAGSKAWRVYEPALPDPLRHDDGRPWKTSPTVAAEWERIKQAPPAVDTVLHPGDVLWVPRGWIHRGITLDEPSLHIGFGFELFTRYWVIQQLVQRLQEFAMLRGELPWGLARDRPRLDAVISEVITDLADTLSQIDRTAAVGQLTADLRRDFLGPVRTPVTAVLDSRIDLDTPVVMVAEAAPCGFTSQSDGAVQFDLLDVRLTLRGETARVTASRWARDSLDPWCARDLLDEGLTETTAIDLVTTLLRTGLARHHHGQTSPLLAATSVVPGA